MFKLATSVDDFKTDDRLDTQLRQIASDRPLDGNNFGGGVISYKFSASSRDMWFVPSKSYLRLRCRLYAKTSANVSRPLKLSDGIAPSLNMGQALFDNIDFLIGGKSLTSTSNLLPSVATLMSRMSASNAHLNCIGDTSTMWEGFTTRQQRVCSDGRGINTGQYNEFYLKESATFQHSSFEATAHVKIVNGVGSCFINATNDANALVDLRDILAPGDELYRKSASDSMLYIATVSTVEKESFHCTNVGSYPNATDLYIISGENGIVVKRYYQLNKDNVAFTELEIAFKPPSPLFYSVKTAIPQSGQMELRLHASQHYRYNAVEAVGTAKPTVYSTASQIAATDGYLFEVISMFLYIYEARGPDFNQNRYFLDMHEIDAQVQNVTSASTQTLSFNVPPKTKALSVAYMDSRTVSDPRACINIFNVNGLSITDVDAGTLTPDNARYVMCAGRSRPINHQVRDFQMQYTGRTFPPLQSDAELSLPSDTALTRRNFMTHRWLDTLKWENKDGSQVEEEDFNTWLERGPYFHFAVDKPGEDNATTCQVSQRFNVPQPSIANLTTVLFAHTRVLAEIVFSEDRRVTAVIRNAIA